MVAPQDLPEQAVDVVGGAEGGTSSAAVRPEAGNRSAGVEFDGIRRGLEPDTRDAAHELPEMQGGESVVVA